MSKISFVMPTWNANFVLSQTLDSFFWQSFDDFDVVIVDDGSTDGTVETLRGLLGDSRFNVVRLDARRGAGNARNIGNELAKSDIICVVDCGDILKEDKALETLKYFEQNPLIDIMCSATECLSGDPPRKPRVFQGLKGEKLGFEHPGVAYTKRVTQKIKYRTTSLETDQYDAFFFEARKAGFNFGVYEQPLSKKCTFTKYDGGRDLDKALLVKAGIYREFNIPLPEWLIEHERRFSNV